MTKRTETGAKGYQRDDDEWRQKAYSLWHRDLRSSLYQTDADFVEWRDFGNGLVAVGVMEVTRVDVGKEVSPSYLDAIVARMNGGLQGTAARTIAAALSTQAWIVLFRPTEDKRSCSEFWFYNLSHRGPWFYCEAPQMVEFLEDLKPGTEDPFPGLPRTGLYSWRVVSVAGEMETLNNAAREEMAEAMGWNEHLAELAQEMEILNEEAREEMAETFGWNEHLAEINREMQEYSDNP